MVFKIKNWKKAERAATSLNPHMYAEFSGLKDEDKGKDYAEEED